MRAKYVSTNGARYGVRFFCPGCGEHHTVPTAPRENGWAFNDDLLRPTLTPSVLVYERRVPADADPASVVPPHKPGDVLSPRCHSYVRAGQIQYLPDSTHALAGQTVELPEVDA